MSIYDEMQQVAREILESDDFKQGSTYLVRVVPGSGPVDDPGPSVETRIKLDGAVRGISWRFVQAGLGVASDLQITHAVVPGIIPAMTDFVESDGVRYKVVQIIARPAAGVTVVYTLIVRR